MADRQRPFYDPATHTHYVELPPDTYDGWVQEDDGAAGIGMLSLTVFADSVSGGDWVWVEREGGDGERLYIVNDLAAVLSPRQERVEDPG